MVAKKTRKDSTKRILDKRAKDETLVANRIFEAAARKQRKAKGN